MRGLARKRRIHEDEGQREGRAVGVLEGMKGLSMRAAPVFTSKKACIEDRDQHLAGGEP